MTRETEITTFALIVMVGFIFWHYCHMMLLTGAPNVSNTVPTDEPGMLYTTVNYPASRGGPQQVPPIVQTHYDAFAEYGGPQSRAAQW